MRPRTKIQKAVAGLYEDLPPLTPKQRTWAERKLFEHTAYRCGRRHWCTDCGHVWERSGEELIDAVCGTELECPKCGGSLKVQHSRKQKLSERYYFTTLLTWHGFQVVRHYIAHRSVRSGNLPHLSINEVAQIWIDEAGREAVVGLPVQPLHYYYDAWKFGGKFEIRERGGSYYRADRFDINAPICPHGGVLAKLRRNGYTSRCNEMAPDKLMRWLLTDNRAETLMKQRQWDCLRLFFGTMGGGGYNQFRPMINICTRHGYTIQDADLWRDLLLWLDELGIDTRNPKNICPKDLRMAHDEIERQVRALRNKKRAEDLARDARQRERFYREEKGNFIGIGFTDGTIRAYVIPSVAELQKEGVAMHHCVWASRYDLRPDALIFSVRDSRGRRLATVELNLKTMQIVQCRGEHNKTPEKDQEIRTLITNNLGLIAEAKKRKTA